MTKGWSDSKKNLLKKLSRKENRLARKLEKTDSAGFEAYKHQPVSFDSIRGLAANDSNVYKVKSRTGRGTAIDTLKGIQSYLSTNNANTDNSGEQINDLKARLNYRNYINDLISKHSNDLKNLSSGHEIPDITGIQKQVFYSKSKMKVFKEMEEEPTKAEDEALEALQGSEGFAKSMGDATGDGAMQGAGGANSQEALQKMGYQTKQQLQKNLQDKFGSGIGAVSQQAGAAVQQWQDKVSDASSGIKDAKQSVSNIRNTQKPEFKVNPMRGLPFIKRLSYHYSWQVTRATGDGKPAIFEPSAMLGFRHTPKLEYGLGMATDLGLGQSWQNIHFSFEGIGLRSFATWKWQYGLGAYAGYERTYKQFAFTHKQSSSDATDVIPTTHNTSAYSESILIGLTKAYRINKKYSGAIQLLYDIWWQQKGLSSPIVLRFTASNL